MRLELEKCSIDTKVRVEKGNPIKEILRAEKEAELTKYIVTALEREEKSKI